MTFVSLPLKRSWRYFRYFAPAMMFCEGFIRFVAPIHRPVFGTRCISACSPICHRAHAARHLTGDVLRCFQITGNRLIEAGPARLRLVLSAGILDTILMRVVPDLQGRPDTSHGERCAEGIGHVLVPQFPEPARL